MRALSPLSVSGVKGLYDFLDLDGHPPSPQAPLVFPCTMYIKKDKFMPKKSKIYLKYKQRSGGSELVSMNERLGGARSRVIYAWVIHSQSRSHMHLSVLSSHVRVYSRLSASPSST